MASFLLFLHSHCSTIDLVVINQIGFFCFAFSFRYETRSLEGRTLHAMNILQHTSLLKTFLGLILLCQCIEDTCSMDDRYQNHRIHRRHTPFLPEDHWKGRPDFGTTNTNVTVMVNGTADLRCPISHIMDSSVSWSILNSSYVLSTPRYATTVNFMSPSNFLLGIHQALDKIHMVLFSNPPRIF